jgi:glycosyltransferase involved in cell wall biosynthesis
VKPHISIVTPSFNQGDYLEQTICSILEQKHASFEYIIIDGGSTDKSVEIIKKYSRYLKYWVSEKDNGQAHAINKGLALSTGEIFNWVNSDDFLEPGILKIVSDYFNANASISAIAGKVKIFSTTTAEIIQNEHINSKDLLMWKQGLKFVQPGVWLRRSGIQKCGGINEHYQYAFDWDLYIRYLYLFPNIKEVDNLLVNFRLHKNSKTISSSNEFIMEEREIICELYKNKNFRGLHGNCFEKIQKHQWTQFLSRMSKSTNPVYINLIQLLFNIPNFYKVSLSRQTLGAINAIICGKTL